MKYKPMFDVSINHRLERGHVQIAEFRVVELM